MNEYPNANEPIADKDLINAMVSRFLCWRLPENFSPDCGISFVKVNHPTSWPTGTNLFDANQAKAMLMEVVAPLLSTSPAIMRKITKDDVTDEMVDKYYKSDTSDYTKTVIVAAVNAYHDKGKSHD